MQRLLAHIDMHNQLLWGFLFTTLVFFGGFLFIFVCSICSVVLNKRCSRKAGKPITAVRQGGIKAVRIS